LRVQLTSISQGQSATALPALDALRARVSTRTPVNSERRAGTHRRDGQAPKSCKSMIYGRRLCISTNALQDNAHCLARPCERVAAREHSEERRKCATSRDWERIIKGVVLQNSVHCTGKELRKTKEMLDESICDRRRFGEAGSADARLQAWREAAQEGHFKDNE
jgi:hypothetical protein